MIVVSFATIASTGAAQEVITPTNHIELFNGKDFTGRTFRMRTNSDSSQTWIVANGVIHCRGEPNGWQGIQPDFAGNETPAFRRLDTDGRNEI